MSAYGNGFIGMGFCDDEKKTSTESYTRGNNERLLPTDDFLKDKNISMGVWGYLQSVSKCNHMDDYRYVALKDATNSKIQKSILKLCKDKTKDGYIVNQITEKTIGNAIQYLIQIGLIIGIVDANEVFSDYKGKFYRLKNKDAFRYYALFENRFLQMLISTIPQEAIKVYLVYYSFNTANEVGQCYLPQKEILERVGLSYAGKNRKKLVAINKILREHGLIKMYYKITKDIKGNVVRKNIITEAPMYWDTKLYQEVQERAENYNAFYTVEYEEIIA